MKRLLILALSGLFISGLVYAGVNIGLSGAVKRKGRQLDEEVKKKKEYLANNAKEFIDRATGGTVELPDGFKIIIPPNALSHSTNITIKRVLSAEAPQERRSFTPMTYTYNVDAEGATLLADATIVAPYDPTQIPSGTTRDQIAIEFYDGEAWIVTDSVTDVANHVLAVDTDHFSGWRAAFDRAFCYAKSLFSSQRLTGIPYFSQDMYGWCVDTSLAMLLQFYGYDIRNYDIANHFDQCDTTCGLSDSEIDQYLTNLGVVAEIKTWDNLKRNHYLGTINYYFLNSKLKHYIKSTLTCGNPLMIGSHVTKQDENLVVGHAYLIVGYNSSGVYISDPSTSFLETYASNYDGPNKLNNFHISWDDFSNGIARDLLHLDDNFHLTTLVITNETSSTNLTGSVQLIPSFFAQNQTSPPLELLEFSWASDYLYGYKYVANPAGSRNATPAYGDNLTNQDKLDLVLYVSNLTDIVKTYDVQVKFRNIATTQLTTNSSWDTSITVPAWENNHPVTWATPVMLSGFSEGEYELILELWDPAFSTGEPTDTTTKKFYLEEVAGPPPSPSSLAEALDNTVLVWVTGGSAAWFSQSVISFFDGDAAQSGDITDSQTSYMQTTVTGPGELTFYWKVDSENNWDFMRFYIDSVEQPGAISGSVGWAQKTYSMTSGSHDLKWAYEKDGSVTLGSDAGWVDRVAYTSGGESVSPPDTPIGTTNGTSSQSYSYSTGGTTSSLGHVVQYRFDWGDGTYSGWSTSTSASHSWVPTGTFAVKAQARCQTHTTVTSVSSGLLVSISGGGGETITFVDGDAIVAGTLNGVTDTNYSYTAGGPDGATSNLGHTVEYRFNWGDGTYSTWSTSHIASHSWTNAGSYSVTAQARCQTHTSVVAQTSVTTVTISGAATETVSPPSTPSGPGIGSAGISYTFTTGSSTSSMGHTVEYRFNWGDGSYSSWSTATSASHSWASTGTYYIRAEARCQTHTTVTALSTSQYGFTVTGLTLGDAVDNTSLTWWTTGNKAWLGETTTYFYGGDAAQSGSITHSQSTVIATSVTGPGTLTFYWKVSSEANYDFLYFYLDGGAPDAQISGEVAWQSKTFAIGSGTHDLAWEYYKDGTESNGQDTGWLDKVEFAP